MSTIPTTSAAELEFQLWMKERVSHFEWFAEKMLPQTGIGAKRLVGAMRFLAAASAFGRCFVMPPVPYQARRRRCLTAPRSRLK